jgi:hypothetical protein
MQGQLVTELYAMGSVVNWSNSMAYMNQQLQNKQTQALNTALNNVNGSDTVPSGDTKVSSLAIDVFGALLCGAASISGFGELLAAGPVVLSFGASLFPDVYSSLASSPSPIAPQISYSQFAALIDQQYGTATGIVTTLVATFSADSILLPLVGGLLNGPPTNKLWVVTNEDILAYVNSNLTPTILQYYSVFIPMRFNFLVWQNTNNNVPYYCRMVHGPNPGMIKVALDPPNNPYLTDTNSPGNFTIYLLCNGSLGWQGTDPNLSYPSAELLTDLFTTRGVSQEDFFHGKGLWAGISNQIADTNC